MKILKRKTLAALLALSLLASLLPLGAQPALAAEEHDSHSNNWTELTAGTTILSDGSYYLSGDVEYSGTEITVSGEVILCLNGHKLNLNKQHISVGSGASLTLCDCSTGGVLTGGSGSKGGGVYVGGGTFTMTGGSIAGNTAESGGGVYVDEGGTFTMEDGSINNNQVTSGGGGGVMVNKGSFTLSGGSITGNATSDATYGYGGGVCLYGTFNLSGDAIIQNNTKANTADNLYLGWNTINITGPLGENARIGVTAEGIPRSFISGWSDNMAGKDPAVYFSSDGDSWSIGMNTAGEAVLGSLCTTITLHPNGGTLPEHSLVAGAALPIPTKTGHTFAGWYENPEFSGNPVTDIPTNSTGELTFYAKWQNIPVTDVKLDKTSLTMQETDSDTLTATVEPDNATNKNVNWKSSDTSIATVDASGKVTAIAPGTATITVTTEDGSKTATCTVIVHTATTITTQPQSVSVTEGQSATFSVTATGDNLRYQWQINSGNGWSAITGATDASYTIDRTTTAMSGNQYHCIVTGDGGEVASDAAMLTVNDRPTIPPVTPPSVSEETIDAILDAEPGETVSVALEDGDTTLDAEVFETLAGQDITLEIALEGGVTWTVNGQDIPADANLDDLDLGVEMNSDGIPANVINAITGEVGTVQLTLAHDGDFGFTMTLTAPLGAENAGYWANLYHFDEDAERLTFETAAEIDADGSVSLSLSHASQYAIVIDDHSHATIDLPFSDVSDSDWFYDSVVWIYKEGLMTGTSATTFEPNTSTTRAMIVSMLARLEGVESAESAGFTDVAADDWYATAVNWAAASGITSGTGDGNFSPNTAITREQLAAILMNYAQYKGQDTSARATLDTYSDAAAISSWANDVMSWAVAEGLLTGVTADTLQPQGAARRAQVAAILQRFLSE